MSTDENTFKRGAWTGDQWQPGDDDDAACCRPRRCRDWTKPDVIKSS